MDHDLSRYLRYDYTSGLLYWLPRLPEDFNTTTTYPKDSLAVSWNKRFSGKEALTAVGNHGYRTGSLLGENTLAHRAIWKLVTGYWPTLSIDHIDGDRLNNSWGNLREVTSGVSSKNKRVRCDNSSGYTGVIERGYGRWSARIASGGKVYSLGTYDTFEEAYEARKQGEKDFGFHKNYGRA